MYAKILKNRNEKFGEWNPIPTIIKNPTINTYPALGKLNNSPTPTRRRWMNRTRNIKTLTKAIYHLQGHNGMFSSKVTHFGEIQVEEIANLNLEKV